MPKDKTEDELDAVSAAYESISAKLEELRKKQAESSDVSDQPSAKSKSETAESRKPKADSTDEDDEAIAEIDIDSEEEIEVKLSPSRKAPEEEELIEPLPGTEEEPELPKKQVYKADDPLDEEDGEGLSAKGEEKDSSEDETDEFEEEEETPKNKLDADETDEEVMSLSQRGAKLQSDADEMEKWEKMKSTGDDEEETAVPKPTYEPLSQADFQSRLRKPQDEELSDISRQSTARNIDNGFADNRERMTESSDEPDSLDDLADETLETANTERTFNNSVRRPTEVDSLEDDWAIRRLRPQHKESYEEEESYSEPAQREFRRPQPQDEESYFDRRNQPLPRKKGSIWHLFILILIGVGVIGATVYFLKYQFNEPSKPTPSPEIATPQPSATPTPTPKPMIEDKEAFKVRVLNGTTKSGLAGTVLAKLKALGYQTDRSGNADKSTYDQTVIKVKEGSQSAALINTITQDLGSEYSPTSETTLKDTDKADVEIILGQK